MGNSKSWSIDSLPLMHQITCGLASLSFHNILENSEVFWGQTSSIELLLCSSCCWNCFGWKSIDLLPLMHKSTSSWSSLGLNNILYNSKIFWGHTSCVKLFSPWNTSTSISYWWNWGSCWCFTDMVNCLPLMHKCTCSWSSLGSYNVLKNCEIFLGKTSCVKLFSSWNIRSTCW